MSNLKQLNKHKNNKTKSEMKHETLTFRFLDMSRGGFARLFLLLLLPCLSVIGVKADSNGGVKFNSAVRYSQWAINSRLYDFKANTKAFGFAKYNSKGGNLSERNNKEIDKLDYVPGLVAKATIEAADYYQGFDWSKPWFLSVKEYGDAYSNSVPNGGGSLDDLNAVKLYIGLFNNTNATKTDKSNYKTAIGLAQEGLVAHNTNNSIQSGTLAGDAAVGGWFHKAAYNNQMWLDGAYMGSALLAQIVNFNGTGSSVFGSTTADWDMVFKQLNIVWNMCWNSTDKLMYHAFEANAGTGTGTNESKSHAETWAGLNGKTEPYTFHSAAYWGRANAWYLMALVDVLEAMKNANQENSTNYTTLKQHLADLAAGIAARQDATTGGWYQVMDKDASFKATSYNSNWSGKPASVTNYIETSATAIFAAAYFKAVRCGLLESTTQYDYKTIAKNAFEGLVNNYTYLDANGDMQIWGSCRSAGLGGGTGTEYAAGGKKYRDGSNEYYLLGNDVPMVKQSEGITEGKVLGGFIMAATEYERAYQNQDNKQILFAKDLAPNYDFTANLDATAYGSDDVSYQWYKDGKAIADATSATYTPKESGSYYCIATSATNSRSAGSNTIQTSTTTVTTANTDNGSTDNNNGGSENGTTTGNIFSYTIKTTEKDANTPYDAEGGTVTLGAAKDDTQKGYKLDGEFGKSVYIKITLSGTKLQEGDIIKISAYSASTGKGGLVAYTGTTAGSSSVSLGNMTQKSEDISYTVKASDILNGISTFYIYGKTNESTYVKSISITRTNTQVALTASFSPATMSATEGDVAQNLPTLTVKAGETTLTANDYTVTYASDNSAVAKVENGKVSFVGEGETNIVATIKPTDTNKYKETSATFTVKVEKKQTPVTPTEGKVIYNWKNIGSQKENIAVSEGTKNINGASVPCINFGSNYNASRYTYMSIKDKDNGGFKAGDIITITGLYTGNKTTGIGMEIHTTRDGKAVFSTPYYNKELQTYTYTLTEDCDSLFFGRYGGATPNVTVLKVVRPAASAKQQLSANFDTNNIKVVTGTTSITLPNLTVKAGSTELAASDYSVNYDSDANEIATLNGTQVNFVSGKTGLVTITAKVTPKDAAKYEGTEAYYQILIQDPTPLNISVTDIDMNTTDAEIKEPVVKVYGENDQLLKLGTDYTLSYSVSNGGPVSFPNGKLTVAGNKYNWTEGVSTITVTATPTESLSKKYKKGSVDFTYTVTKGLITPKFLDVFSGANIKLAVKSGDKNNFNTFTVPLIYDGEDVSSYFDYTYVITSTSTANTQNVNGNVLTYYPKNAGTYTVKVSATVKTNEKDPTLDYTDVYAAPSSITFTLDVKANYIRPVVKLNPVSVNMYTGTREDAPDVTITDYNTGKVIDESNYEVSWTTFTPGICKVDANGNIEAVSEGDGKIRVVVTGASMESTTAFLKVLVDDPVMYRVKGTGIKYGNHTTMWNQDKTMSVVLGGWLFSDDVTKKVETPNTSTEGLSAGYYWGPGASLPKWKLTGFDYYVVGDKNKNARQENGSNALPETTNIYSADFKSYTGTIKDKMFNVPCSGSFLEFNPATNGKVTVHIFQNGAFDAKTTKKKDGTVIKEYQYRPQRRVFVMDEAGNFVESEAHIETTSGKPTGGIQTIDKYTWDLNSKTLTIEDVRSHFKGIPTTFDMTTDAFKNDVYESLLSNDLVPNAAAGKGNGSMGWSVLADSPVTYTFNVKAGKTYYLYNFGSKIGFYGFSFDEGETKPTVDPVNYNADDANANNVVEKTAEDHVAQVKIARKMVANRWTTCVLPFSLNRQQVDAIFGPAYSATAKEGTQILYFDHIEGSKAYFVRHAYNTIVAGKPFLIKPTKEVTSINTADVADYPYVTIENETPADWCESKGYVWTSSYNTMNIAKNDYFIGASDGKFKAYSAASGTVKGFRGFLKANPAGAKPVMLRISTSSITDGNDGETTGIEDLIINADGELMPANCRVYNINGQLVSEDASSFQSLPSGIYIINGKKYIK